MNEGMRKAGLVLGFAAMAILGETFLGGAQARVQSGAAGHEGASAILMDASGNRLGIVKFSQKSGEVLVRASVQGLSPGFHGFHVHANNDPSNGTGCIADPSQPSSTWFVSVDGHYKLGSEVHGAHQGDMPLLMLNGTGTLDSWATSRFETDRFAVADIIGRAVIVHALADNFNNIPLGTGSEQYTANSQAAVDKTNASGNAGDRLLCGVVEATG
jgi:Cu-Zn family superoxide dismutase